MGVTNFVEELEWRGLLHDISERDVAKKIPSNSSFYIGMDPSAPSLQLGNLISILTAIRIARCGVHPIILFGGATGSIGDPSGKRAERQLLDRESIDRNVASQRKKVSEICERVGVRPDFVNNMDWTKDVSVLEFLRDIGKHFTVNYMIAKDVVKARLEGDGISFTEFAYMLLQAYDFYYLYQNKSCRLQIGGSDQWGNITAGLELIRRKIKGEAYALSWPLLLDGEGKKFGKSEGNAIWLDTSLTSAYRFHQFWINVPDSEVIRYIKIFTFHTEQEVKALEESVRTAPEKREAQTALADSVCTLVHGEAATEEAKRSAQVLFGGSIAGIPEEQLEEIFKDVPSSTLTRSKIASINIIDLLVETKSVPSKSEAKRLIGQGGAYLNNERITDSNLLLTNTSIGARRIAIIRTGKKNYHLIKISNE